MADQPVLPLLPAVVGIDPGSRQVGVALISSEGKLVATWSIKGAEKDLLVRYRNLCSNIYQVFKVIQKQYADCTVVIEGPHFKSTAMVINNLGTVRGIILANAWRLSMRCAILYTASWKARLTPEEREMEKDKAYVRYWNAKWSSDCRSADEIDAVHIGKRYVIGRSK